MQPADLSSFILLAITFPIAWMAIVHVPHGMVYVVSRKGQPYRVLVSEPFRWRWLIVPFIDKVTARLDITPHELSFADLPLTSRDGQLMTADGHLYWQIDDPLRYVAHAPVDIRAGLVQLVADQVALTLAQVQSAEGTAEDMPKLQAALSDRLAPRFAAWGLSLKRLSFMAGPANKSR